MNFVGRNIMRESEQGSSLLETALLLPMILLMVAGAIDFGRGYAVAIQVASAAQAGALYGVQNPGDTTGMENAATLDAPGLTTLTTSATYGCECYDGSSAVPDCTAPPTCANNYVNYASVTASATYTPLLSYPGIPKTLTLTNTVRLRSGGD